MWTAVSHIRPGLVPVSSQNNDAAQGIREIPPRSRSGRNVGTAVQASIIAILYLVWPAFAQRRLEFLHVVHFVNVQTMLGCTGTV